MLRVSFGLYNTRDEVDALVDALKKISRGDFKGKYQQNQASGEFIPEGWQVDYDQYFRF